MRHARPTATAFSDRFGGLRSEARANTGFRQHKLNPRGGGVIASNGRDNGADLFMPVARRKVGPPAQGFGIGFALGHTTDSDSLTPLCCLDQTLHFGMIARVRGKSFTLRFTQL